MDNSIKTQNGMKVILGCLDPNSFYKLVIDDNTVDSVIDAMRWMDRCPYEGVLFIYAPIFRMNDKTWETCKIIVDQSFVTVSVESYLEDELLLAPDEDLLSLPDVYLTKRFRVLLEDAKKHLTEDDVNLIESWEYFHEKM